MLKEFKAFAMRGNLIDMAVAVVIGAAFGAVTKVFIEGLFMPFVGLIFQVEDLSSWTLKVGTSAEGAPVMIQIGAFAGVLINFVIIAFAMFLVVKGMNALKRKEEAAPAPPPAPSREETLLTEIRDLLKNK